MGPFIYVSKKWIPLSRVKEALVDDKGQTTIVTIDDEEHFIGGNDLDDRIISITAAPPGWELIEEWEGEEEGTSIIGATPIMAFGLTALGHTKPITGNNAGGVEGDYGVRAPGDQRVASWTGVFESADAWLKANKRGQPL